MPADRPRRRPHWITLALVVAVVAAAWWSLHAGGSIPVLVEPNPAGTTSFWAAIPDIRAGQPVSLAGVDVCVQGSTGLRFDRVELLDPHNITLQTFAIRPLPAAGQLGEAPGLLSRLGFPDAGSPVTINNHCSPNTQEPIAGVWEVGVQLARTAAGTGVEHGLMIRYTSDGTRLTLTIPFIITLCAPGETTIADCRFPPGRG